MNVTMSYSDNKKNNKLKLFLLLGITIMLLFPALPKLNSFDVVEKNHATDKHASASTVRCALKNNVYNTYVNPETKRIARCVPIEVRSDGKVKVGIQVIEYINNQFEEVTSFIKDRFCDWDQIVNYFVNTGYVPK